jgi:hypothetical protein
MPYPLPGPCWTGDLFIDTHRYEIRMVAANEYGVSGHSTSVFAEPLA